MFGYSMPSESPLYPEPPYHYENNKVISILFRTTPEILRELVPTPLQPNPDHLAFIYIGEFNVTSPVKASYREIGIGIPVSLNEKWGNYFAFLYLDPPLAIVPGREIWGWPKKDAEIKFVAEEGMLRVRAVREGITLVQASVKSVEPVKPIPPQADLPAFNLKIIPSVKRNHRPDVLQLTSAITVSKKKEVFRGEATLMFGSSKTDLLGKIAVLEILSGEYSIEDLSLDCGDVILDYLARDL